MIGGTISWSGNSRLEPELIDFISSLGNLAERCGQEPVEGLAIMGTDADLAKLVSEHNAVFKRYVPSFGTCPRCAGPEDDAA